MLVDCAMEEGEEMNIQSCTLMRRTFGCKDGDRLLERRSTNNGGSKIIGKLPND